MANIFCGVSKFPCLQVFGQSSKGSLTWRDSVTIIQFYNDFKRMSTFVTSPWLIDTDKVLVISLDGLCRQPVRLSGNGTRLAFWFTRISSSSSSKEIIWASWRPSASVRILMASLRAWSFHDKICRATCYLCCVQVVVWLSLLPDNVRVSFLILFANSYTYFCRRSFFTVTALAIS